MNYKILLSICLAITSLQLYPQAPIVVGVKTAGTQEDVFSFEGWIFPTNAWAKITKAIEDNQNLAAEGYERFCSESTCGGDYATFCDQLQELASGKPYQDMIKQHNTNVFYDMYITMTPQEFRESMEKLGFTAEEIQKYECQFENLTEEWKQKWKQNGQMYLRKTKNILERLTRPETIYEDDDMSVTTIVSKLNPYTFINQLRTLQLYQEENMSNIANKQYPHIMIVDKQGNRPNKNCNLTFMHAPIFIDEDEVEYYHLNTLTGQRIPCYHFGVTSNTSI